MVRPIAPAKYRNAVPAPYCLPMTRASFKLDVIMSSSSHAERASALGAVREETQALWERNRLRCGWFLRRDFVPETRDDLLRCLHLLARHGDRNTFVLARKLEKCL